MSEYIEREAALLEIEEWADTFCECDYVWPHVIESITKLPAADVAPVVTCADCKYNKREVTDLWGNDAIQCITGQTHRPDWFCADGKKREEI